MILFRTDPTLLNSPTQKNTVRFTAQTNTEQTYTENTIDITAQTSTEQTDTEKNTIKLTAQTSTEQTDTEKNTIKLTAQTNTINQLHRSALHSELHGPTLISTILQISVQGTAQTNSAKHYTVDNTDQDLTN